MGRLVKVTAADGTSEEFVWDADGRLLNLKALSAAGVLMRSTHQARDPAGHVTAWSRDLLDSQGSVLRTLTAHLEYGPALLLAKTTLPTGQAATVTRDGLHRVTSISVAQDVVEFEYDLHDNVVKPRKEYNAKTTQYDIAVEE